MLVLLFSAGPHRCALPCGSVREVISSVALRPLAGGPRHLAGVFSYRGVVTPVADFCLLQSGTPCSNRLSSRELSSQAGARAELPYLGRVVVDEGEMINLLDPDELLKRAFTALPELSEGGVEGAHAALEHRL